MASNLIPSPGELRRRSYRAPARGAAGWLAGWLGCQDQHRHRRHTGSWPKPFVVDEIECVAAGLDRFAGGQRTHKCLGRREVERGPIAGRDRGLDGRAALSLRLLGVHLGLHAGEFLVEFSPFELRPVERGLERPAQSWYVGEQVRAGQVAVIDHHQVPGKVGSLLARPFEQGLARDALVGREHRRRVIDTGLQGTRKCDRHAITRGGRGNTTGGQAESGEVHVCSPSVTRCSRRRSRPRRCRASSSSRLP